MERGARLVSSPKEVAQCSDVVFTMVGFPHDGMRVPVTSIHYPCELTVASRPVRSVILGATGVLKGLNSGGVLVDMTTSEPSLALEIYNESKKKGVHSIDAPVSGTSHPS